MISENINKMFSNILKINPAINKLKYMLGGYRHVVSYQDIDPETLKLKVLPIYSYIESHRKRNAFYSFLYSVLLVASVATLI